MNLTSILFSDKARFHALLCGKTYFLNSSYLIVKKMSNKSPPLTIFHMLEKHLGKRIHVIIGPSYGFEGKLAAVTTEPPGIWLSNAVATVLRSTIAQPIPQVVSREERSEIFINLNFVQRIEILHE